MDSETADDTQNNDATTPSQKFGSNLIAELLAIVSHGLGGISGAALMFMVVFMLETLLRSSSAKLYFVCGYIVVLVIFYATAVICFPPSDGTATAGTYDDDGSGGTADDASAEGMGGGR